MARIRGQGFVVDREGIHPTCGQVQGLPDMDPARSTLVSHQRQQQGRDDGGRNQFHFPAGASIRTFRSMACLTSGSWFDFYYQYGGVVYTVAPWYFLDLLGHGLVRNLD